MYYSSHYKERNIANPPGNALKIYSFVPLYLNNDICQKLTMIAFKTFQFALGNKITLPVVFLFIPRNP